MQGVQGTPKVKTPGGCLTLVLEPRGEDLGGGKKDFGPESCTALPLRAPDLER